MFKNRRFFSGIWHWARRRFTRAGLCAACALVMAGSTGIDVEHTVTYQSFALLLAVLGLAILGSLRWRARFTVERVLPRLGTAGQPLHYRVLVRQAGNRPISGLSLLEDLADPRPDFATWFAFQRAEGRREWKLRAASHRRADPFRMAVLKEGDLPPLPARGTAEAKMQLLPLRRGVLRFSGVTVARPDVLGLFRAVVRVPAPQTVLILPRRYPVPSLKLPGSLRYQQGGVTLAVNVGSSDEFVALRDYRPGDPLRHIHWRSWARAGRPVVKEFADEHFVRHALVLDTFTDEPGSEILEEAVSVAASFACTVMTQESLLDLLFVGAQSYCFTAGRGLAAADHLLEVLAGVGPTPGRPVATLEHLVLEHAGRISGCICVLLAWDESRQHLVRRLQQAGVPLLVLVVVPPGGAGEGGPLAREVERFHFLELGRVGIQLGELR